MDTIEICLSTHLWQPTDSWPNSVASPTRGGLTVAATRHSMNSLSTRKSATLQQRPASLYSHIDKEQLFMTLKKEWSYFK